jgi:hypothetical protein
MHLCLELKTLWKLQDIVLNILPKILKNYLIYHNDQLFQIFINVFFIIIHCNELNLFSPIIWLRIKKNYAYLFIFVNQFKF